MMQTPSRPSGFIEPCQPSKVARPPSGPLWVHEIKHDGYRLMVRRDGGRVRCFTRNGHDWADRFPAIVDAALRIKAQSFMIDGEAVIARDDGTPDFHALRSKRSVEAVLIAFDLIELHGRDRRDLPLLDRKRRLARLIGKTKNWRAIQYGDYLKGDGPAVATSATWGWKALSRSGRTRRTAAVRQGRGSRRRTRQATRCAGNARRNGDSIMLSPKRKTGGRRVGDETDTNASRDRFDAGRLFRIKCHALSLAAVEHQR
jgi:bifunctional non-homologous end joining protein LigD